MLFGDYAEDEHGKQCAAEDQREHDPADRHRAHDFSLWQRRPVWGLPRQNLKVAARSGPFMWTLKPRSKPPLAV